MAEGPRELENKSGDNEVSQDTYKFRTQHVTNAYDVSFCRHAYHPFPIRDDIVLSINSPPLCYVLQQAVVPSSPFVHSDSPVPKTQQSKTLTLESTNTKTQHLRQRIVFTLFDRPYKRPPPHPLPPIPVVRPPTQYRRDGQPFWAILPLQPPKLP